MARLVAQNEQLSNLLAQMSAPEPLPPDQLMELLRLRGEVSVLRRQQPELDKTREENRQIHAAVERYRKSLTETNAKATADYWPRNSWTNCGYGSPEAALQTLHWAASNGDLTNFLTSVADEARKEIASSFEGKSEAEVSLRLADEMSRIESVQILGREATDDNTVLIAVGADDQDEFQTIKIVMRKIGGEWKFAGPQR